MELVPDQVDVLGRATPRRTEAYQAYLKGRYHWNRGRHRRGATPPFAITSARSISIPISPPRIRRWPAPGYRSRITSNEPGRALLEQASVGTSGRLNRSGEFRMRISRWQKIRRTLEWNWRARRRRVSNGDRACRRAARRRTGSTRSFSRRCRGSAKRKPKPTARCDVDPFCLVVTTSAAWVRYAAGEFDAAIDRCRYVAGYGCRIHARTAPARGGVACRRKAGRGGRGAAGGRGARCDDDPISLAWLAHAKAIAGDRDEAGAIVAKIEAELPSVYVPAYHLALAHTGLGNRDAAFATAREGVRRTRSGGRSISRSSRGSNPSAATPDTARCFSASICNNRTARTGRFCAILPPSIPSQIALISTGLRGGVS